MRYKRRAKADGGSQLEVLLMYMPSTDTDGHAIARDEKLRVDFNVHANSSIGLLVSAYSVGQNIKHTFS